MTIVSEKPPRFLAVILCCLSAIGPLAIDMYLPALPRIAGDLHADEGSIQLSLMTFFAGLMLGQLVYGPLSDKLGRKPLIYLGLGVFIPASFACAFVTDAHQLIALRFVEGVGGSIGLVISFAVVRDLYAGSAAGRLQSLIAMTLGVSPIVAPLIGSAAVSAGSWRLIFVTLGVFAIVLLAFVVFKLPETRLSELRRVSRPADTLKYFSHLLANRHFIPFVLSLCIAQAGFFAYLSASASVFISFLGMTPLGYSVIFAVNALGLVFAAKLSPTVVERFGAYLVVRTALATYLVVAVALLAMTASGTAMFLPVAALLFVLVFTLGFIMPLSSVLAMESFGAISGTAAALMGAFQFGAGAIASGLTGAFANGTATPMASIIAVCGVVSTVIAMTAYPERAATASHSAH